jgi:hypothetical protein
MVAPWPEWQAVIQEVLVRLVGLFVIWFGFGVFGETSFVILAVVRCWYRLSLDVDGD